MKLFLIFDICLILEDEDFESPAIELKKSADKWEGEDEDDDDVKVFLCYYY